jgi:hypothetical protein
MTKSVIVGKILGGILGGILGVEKFSPTDISGLALWLDASFGVTGELVGAWPDRSLNGNDFAQLDVDHKPVFDEEGLNGFPAVGFVMINNTRMQASSSDSLDIVDSFTSFVVQQTAGSIANNHFYSKNFNNGYRFRLDPNRNPQTVMNDGSGVQADLAGAIIPLNVPLVLSLHYTVGGTIEFRSNGVALGAFPSNTLTSIESGTENMVLGATNSATPVEFFNGEIAQVIIYNRLLTVNEQNRVGNYLADRYDLTWTDVT